MPVDLSVVIVNWNTAPLVLDCLRALFSSPAGVERDVTVVDNGSTDDSASRIAAGWPQVRLIRNARNLGFAAANNQGIASTAGRYVLLLNSDTIASPASLERLVAFMDAHPEAGACGPRLENADGSVQPYAFGDDPTPAYLTRRRLYARLGRALHDWGAARTQEVGWVSGACLMARRAAIEQAGPLDEQMFMYFEDNDWCLRMRQRGWKIYFVPEVSITHLGGGSAATADGTARAYDQSLRIFYRKHYGVLAQLWLAVARPR